MVNCFIEYLNGPSCDDVHGHQSTSDGKKEMMENTKEEEEEDRISHDKLEALGQ